MRFEKLFGWWSGAPPALRLGAVATVGWTISLFAYALGNGDKFCDMKPNELGDFLAGTFAPLAFLWLVVAVLLQKQELELQREELKQSRNALELQAGETRALVEEYKRAVDVSVLELELQRNTNTEHRLLQEMDNLQFRFRALERSVQLTRIEDGKDFRIGSGLTQIADAQGVFRQVSLALKKVVEAASSSPVILRDQAAAEFALILTTIDRIAHELDRTKHPAAWNRYEALRLSRVRERLFKLIELTVKDQATPDNNEA